MALWVVTEPRPQVLPAAPQVDAKRCRGHGQGAVEGTTEKKLKPRDARVAQQLSISRGPGIKSHIGLPSGSLLLPLPVSLPLSLCLSRINK